MCVATACGTRRERLSTPRVCVCLCAWPPHPSHPKSARLFASSHARWFDDATAENSDVTVRPLHMPPPPPPPPPTARNRGGDSDRDLECPGGRLLVTHHGSSCPTSRLWSHARMCGSSHSGHRAPRPKTGAHAPPHFATGVVTESGRVLLLHGRLARALATLGCFTFGAG